MNFSKNISMYIAILLLVGCGTKSSNQFLAGYYSPGDFRPQGIAHEKGYRFTNITPNRPGFPPDPAVVKSCTSLADGTGICIAVHCIWYISQSLTSFNNAFPTEGIAVNDKNLPQPNFVVKISRVIGTPWNIEMVVNGVRYSASTNDVRLTQFASVDQTAPFYDPTPGSPNSGDEFAASGIFLNLIYVEFLNDIYLYAIPPDPNVLPPDMSKPFIKIAQTDPLGRDPNNLPAGGDYIVTADYGL